MNYANPDLLVSTQWLEDHLDDRSLRILDCTVYLRPTEEGTVRPDSGHEDWKAAHIPGSFYADLLEDLSDRNTTLPVMMPPADQFADAMEGYGVSDDSRVILYDAAEGAWAARVWWMLRAFGFDNAALLNGGLKKWRSENRPLTDEQTQPQRGHFNPKPRPALISHLETVLEATESTGTTLINALSPEEFTGEVCRVARPGRIPGSHNVPASRLINPRDNTFHSADALDALFRRAGIQPSQPIITYCGGGIAASALAFALTLMGQDEVSLYDGSLVEWSANPDLPMETG